MFSRFRTLDHKLDLATPLGPHLDPHRNIAAFGVAEFKSELALGGACRCRVRTQFGRFLAPTAKRCNTVGSFGKVRLQGVTVEVEGYRPALDECHRLKNMGAFGTGG